MEDSTPIKPAKGQRQFRHPDQGYPAGRPQYFAMHYLQRIVEERVIGAMPPKGLALLVVVAIEEDSNRYKYPASFYNDALTARMGCSEDTLERTRDALIGLGLLRYERSATRSLGIYWLVEPLHWRPIVRTRADTNADASAGTTADASAGASADPLTLYSSNPKTPHTSPLPEVSGREIEIAQLAKELSELGVSLAMQAASTALGRRMPPDFIQPIPFELVKEHVAHFREHELGFGLDGPGILYKRMADPNIVIHQPRDGWPKLHPGYYSYRKEWERLERKYGAIVDGLTEAEMLEQIEDANLEAQRVAFPIHKLPPVRFLCLGSIENRVIRAEQQRLAAQREAESTTQSQLPAINWKELEKTNGPKVDQLNDIELRALVSRVGSQFGLRTETLEISRRQDFVSMFRRELLQAVDIATN